MKYRLSILIGCIAVLLGVLSFAACKDKKDKDVESGYSIVGTWVHTEKDSYYGTVTITIQFKSDNTGSYSYNYDGETHSQALKYTYDPSKCTGTVLMYDYYGGTEETTFKLTWYDANTVTVSFYNAYYGTWNNLGSFTRKTDSGGGGSSGGTGYSVVGTWKHSEYSNYYGWETTTIVFSANGTGTFTYSSGEGSSVYSVQYNYNSSTCIGDLLMIYDDPDYGRQYYPLKFKVKWYSANSALIYTKYDNEEYDEWEELGVFERQ